MHSKMWTVFCLIGFLALVLPGCGGGGGGSGEVAPSVPTGLTLTPQSIKTFRFEWQDSDGETEYRLMENPDGVSGYAEVATLPADSTEHELTVSLPGRINASYALLACNDAGCRDSDPVFVNTNLAEAVGYFKASNTGSGDEFGRSVALSSDGKTLAVGAESEDSDANGITNGINGPDNDDAPGSGAVYVFVKDEGNWSQQAYVKSFNSDAGDRFGGSVALSGDGNTLAVGAIGEAGDGKGVDAPVNDLAAEAGAVYVFSRAAETWSQQSYIKAAQPDAGDGFGISVSLSFSGDTLAVGAWGEASATTISINGDQTDNSAPFAGAAYVYSRNDGDWSQQAYIKGDNTEGGDEFGVSVALSSNGDTLAVGATGEGSDAEGVGDDGSNNNATFSGAAYVFFRNGGNWSQQAYVKASNTGSDDFFGSPVALSSDGDTLAVASSDDSNATGINGDPTNDDADSAGAVHVFVRTAGKWSQQAYVKPSNTNELDGFGSSIALSSDGSMLVIGAENEDGDARGINGDGTDNSKDEAGAVYRFGRDSGVWSQSAYVKASNTTAEDTFGSAVAISADGESLAVGARQEDSNAEGIDGDQSDDSFLNAGAVYLY